MKPVWLIGLACLACCLPLVGAFFGAAGSAGIGGLLGGLDWEEIACIAPLFGAAAAIWLLRRRRGSARHCDVKD